MKAGLIIFDRVRGLRGMAICILHPSNLTLAAWIDAQTKDSIGFLIKSKWNKAMHPSRRSTDKMMVTQLRRLGDRGRYST